MTSATLYDEDLVVWAERQGEALRRAAREGSNLPLDWENLAEEIESLGRSQRSQVKSLVHTMVAHLIKLAYSPAQPAWFDWESEVGLYRQQLEGVIETSPSLRPSLPEIVAREVPPARRTAVLALRKYGEMDAAAMVEGLTLTITPEQVLDHEWFLPGTYEGLRAQLTSRS